MIETRPNVEYGDPAVAFGGEVERDEVSAEITALERKVRDLLDSGKTAVRAHPNVAAATALAIDFQRQHWRWQS